MDASMTDGLGTKLRMHGEAGVVLGCVWALRYNAIRFKHVSLKINKWIP